MKAKIELLREGSVLPLEGMRPLSSLLLWIDPVARSGAECMAIDEALLELSPLSVLRIYQWGQPTVTYGYFDKQKEAEETYPGEGISYVRRWTGGGIVDHRSDVAFTLALLQPKGQTRPQSPLLYRWIHGSLARVLRDCGVECVMLTEDAPEGNRSCFSSPVTSDLVGPKGEKLAGGGQRRTRRGVLHQGSIQGCSLPEGWGEKLAARLSVEFTLSREEEPIEGLLARAQELLLSRYLADSWPTKE